MDREKVTDLLDLAALALFAVGLAGGLWEWLGWWALCVAAAPVLAVSAVTAARANIRPRQRRKQPTELDKRRGA